MLAYDTALAGHDGILQSRQGNGLRRTPSPFSAAFTRRCVCATACSILELNDAEGKLTDTGRGMRLTPDKGDTLAHAERALTGFYPCLPSNPEFDAILRDLVWGELGSPGPSFANFACRSFKFTSMRDGEIWSQSYSYGIRSGPAVMLGSTEMTGTVIDFKTTEPIDHAVVATLVEALRSRIPGLSIALRSHGRNL